MNRALSIFLAVVAIALLVTGYTWRGRSDRDREISIAVRIDSRVRELQRTGKPLGSEDRFEGFDEVADAQEKRTAELIGTVQYCTGWIVFGLAAVLWCLPVAKKVENTSC